MYTIKILLPLLALSYTLIACSTTSENDKKDNLDAVAKDYASSTKDIRSCIEKNDHQLAQLLSMEHVQKHVDATHHANIKVETNNQKNKYGNIVYKYKSDRTYQVQVGSIIQEIPDYNTFELTGVGLANSDAERALEIFERSYKKLSDEAYEEMSANLEKSYADKSKASLEQAKKLLEARKHLNYTEVSNLGTAAYLKEVNVKGNNFGVELVVLAGTATFTVRVKVSDDNSMNADKAVAIAKDIIQKCS